MIKGFIEVTKVKSFIEKRYEEKNKENKSDNLMLEELK